MIRSPPSAFVSISTWPRTMSSNATTPSPTRKRMTGLRPSASRAARCSARQMRAATHVVRRLVGGLLGLAVRVQLLGRAVAVVGLVLAQELIGDLAIAVEPLHLAIRAVRTLARAGPATSGPSSQSMPSQCIWSRMSRS